MSNPVPAFNALSHYTLENRSVAHGSTSGALGLREVAIDYDSVSIEITIPNRTGTWGS